MLRFNDVCFSYEKGQEQTIDNVSFTVEQGQWLALLGANGSGKSTLALLANGLLLPDSGSVEAFGFDTRRAATLRSLRSRVGIVLQDPDHQIVCTTVADEVAFGPENLGLSREEIAARVAEALASVGLAGYGERDPNTLSGGEKQRLVIAGAMAMRPGLLVLDEPLAMLDPASRDEVLATVAALHGAGTSMLYITHSHEEAMLADSAHVLSGGRMVFSGQPAEAAKHVRRPAAAAARASAAAALSEAVLQGRPCRAVSAVSPLNHAQAAASARPPYRDALGRDVAANPPLDHAQAAPSPRPPCRDALGRALSPKAPPEHGRAAALGDLAPPAALGDLATPEAPSRKRAEAATTRRLTLVAQTVSFAYEADGASHGVLSGVSITLKPGTITLLLGRSGVGKSTLLRLLAGLLAPCAGKIATVDESGVSEEPAPGSNIGIVFQRPEGQLFAATVHDDVAFGPRTLHRHISAAELQDVCRRALEGVGLSYGRFASRSPFALSGGQARLAAIAGILAMEPPVLLLDEPTASLDEQGRETIARLLQNQARQGRSILLATHDADFLLPYADSVAVLDETGLVTYTAAEFRAKGEVG